MAFTPAGICKPMARHRACVPPKARLQFAETFFKTWEKFRIHVVSVNAGHFAGSGREIDQIPSMQQRIRTRLSVVDIRSVFGIDRERACLLDAGALSLYRPSDIAPHENHHSLSQFESLQHRRHRQCRHR
ncbi:hypothetical protein HQ447_02420, partial [bacterium]|nr:hypothetical protein [bacterium]